MALEEDRWLVIDHLRDNKPHHYALHWLLADFPFEQSGNSVLLSLNGMSCKVQVGLFDGAGKMSVVRADPNSTHGWRSQYYGYKEPAISLLLETDQPQATFWTFFGFEGDQAELHEKTLKIGSTSIDLNQLQSNTPPG
jgi:hypothetical protein